MFAPEAHKEWQGLQPAIRAKLEKKLAGRLEYPEVAKDRLAGSLAGNYKIKLNKEGIRLVYLPIPERGVIFVRSVGSRADKDAYRKAAKRLPA